MKNDEGKKIKKVLTTEQIREKFEDKLIRFEKKHRIPIDIMLSDFMVYGFNKRKQKRCCVNPHQFIPSFLMENGEFNRDCKYSTLRTGFFIYDGDKFFFKTSNRGAWLVGTFRFDYDPNNFRETFFNFHGGCVIEYANETISFRKYVSEKEKKAVTNKELKDTQITIVN